MAKTTPDPQPEKGLDGRSTDEDVREDRSQPDWRLLVEHSKSDEKLRLERLTTDESLREERSKADELLDPGHGDEQRVVEVVRESQAETERVLHGVRADSDAQREKQADGLPEMSEKLAHVAESLSKAAASLQESSGDRATNIAQISEGLQGAAAPAAPPGPPPAPPDVSEALTERLAEIADGIAEITSTLSQERLDADLSLLEEREVTDQLIVQELNQVETTLKQEVRDERQALRQDRQATDEDLANERRNTDDAVEHVEGLLDVERRDHAHAALGIATRNEFLSIVSHDLRGPLMTISGVAALIDKQAPIDETGRRMREWADRLRRSVSVMERLISDLLDFNSFEDGQLRVAAERLDFRTVIHDAIDSFHGVAQANGLSLEADLPADPVMTKHDPHRMLQVLSNLIHNAIKFTAEGGSIRIRVARAGTFYRVSVLDTGIGIPAGDLTGIFERFRQLDPSNHLGLGLGLYISQWIVEAHGGKIWAESQVGVGTTFHFTLPEERRSS